MTLEAIIRTAIVPVLVSVVVTASAQIWATHSLIATLAQTVTVVRQAQIQSAWNTWLVCHTLLPPDQRGACQRPE